MTTKRKDGSRHSAAHVCLSLFVAWILSAPLAVAELPALEPRTALFDRLSEEEGLSQAVVHAIAQDTQGYIWLGTQEGLNRYDGRELRLYERISGDPGSLSDNYVWSLLVDDSGKLWVGTESGGLNLYNRESASFTQFRHDPADDTSLSSDRVRVVYQDRRGSYWIGTDGGGLNKLDPGGRLFERFRHDPTDASSLPSDAVLAILEDRAGNLWVGTRGGGLSLMDRETGTFRHFQHDPANNSSISGNLVRNIYEDRDGRLWVGTYEGGVNLFDADRGTFQSFTHNPDDPRSLSNNRVRDIAQDRNGTIWIATDRGLNEWRPADGGFARYYNAMGDDFSISDNRVTTILQDRGGVLWVGTYNGANRWNYLSDAFTYFQSQGTELRLSSNIITSVDESSSGDLWVGTYGGGLNRINEATGTVRYYRKDLATPAKALLDDRVMAVHVDDSQQVWLGTRSAGLSVLNIESGEFRHFRNDPDAADSLSSDAVTSILAEPSGIVWAGTYGGGLNRLDTGTGRFTHFRFDADNESSLGSDRVLALFRDRQGTLWVGTEDGGLNAFDNIENTFKRIQHDPEDSNSLSRDSAWLIEEGDDGSLWVGTNGGGLNRWRPEDRDQGIARFSHYRRSDGLLSDSVQGLVEDSDGEIWISSNRGLVQLNPHIDSLRTFSRSNGLRSNEFNFGATQRTRSSRLLFGSSAGLLAFYPNHITVNRHQPQIALTAFNRDGPLSRRYSSDGGGEVLELDHNTDLVTFGFRGLDYAAPEKNRYRYKLEGFDKQWSEAAEYDRATYTSLPAGRYTFHVQASNNDGVWNKQGASIALQVSPAPWLSAAALFGYGTVLSAAIFLFMRSQSRKLDKETRQRREMEQLVQARTRELAQRNQDLESLNDQLRESSLTDTLTGLKNRRYLTEFIESEVATARRQASEFKTSESMADSLDIAPALSFMMVDLDGFKAINDQHGHPAGDAALLQVRDILKDSCRKSDTIIRWGGDEFLIVSRNTSNRAAEKLAERIRVGLAEHNYQLGNGKVGNLSGSIGFAVYPFSPLKPDLISWEHVTSIADQCTYIAKDNGRNAWVGIYGTRDTRAEDVQKIGTDLETLVANRQVGIRTSIYGKLVLSKTLQQESK